VPKRDYFDVSPKLVSVAVTLNSWSQGGRAKPEKGRGDQQNPCTLGRLKASWFKGNGKEGHSKNPERGGGREKKNELSSIRWILERRGSGGRTITDTSISRGGSKEKERQEWASLVNKETMTS